MMLKNITRLYLLLIFMLLITALPQVEINTDYNPIVVCQNKVFTFPIYFSHHFSETVIVKPEFSGAASRFIMGDVDPLSVGPGNQVIFKIKMGIPKDTEPGEYPLIVKMKTVTGADIGLMKNKVIVKSTCDNISPLDFLKEQPHVAQIPKKKSDRTEDRSDSKLLTALIMILLIITALSFIIYIRKNKKTGGDMNYNSTAEYLYQNYRSYNYYDPYSYYGANYSIYYNRRY